MVVVLRLKLYNINMGHNVENKNSAYRDKVKLPLLIRLNGRSLYQRVLSGLPQTRGMRSGCVSLAGGREVGEHSTKNREEVLIILSGKGAVIFNKYPAIAIKKSTVVYIPPRTRHNVKNTGRSKLRYLYVVSPVV